MKRTTLRFLLEYCCYPIWKYENTDVYNISVDEIDINPYLKKEIEELDNMYQDTFNTEYPPEPLHDDDTREYIFVNRVLVCAKLLEKELAGKYEFIFDWEYWENKLKKLEETMS